MPIHASLSLARCAVLRADTKEWKGGGEERQNSGARLSNRERRMGEGYGEGRKRGRVVGGNRQDRATATRERERNVSGNKSFEASLGTIKIFPCFGARRRSVEAPLGQATRSPASSQSSLPLSPLRSSRRATLSACRGCPFVYTYDEEPNEGTHITARRR